MIRVVVALLLAWAAPASASFLYRGAGAASYPAASPCTADVVTHSGEEIRVVNCGIGESFFLRVPFLKDSSNSWSYLFQWETPSAGAGKVCLTVEAAALPDGADADATVTETVASVPDAAGDASQGADAVNISGWSSPVAVRNADGDVSCAGTPSVCEHAEVRLIVTRVACSADDLAGDASIRMLVADTNP